MKRFKLLLVLFVATFCAGCGYGEVSPQSYKLASSLYNVSNRKLSEKLGDISKQIESALETNQISKKEAAWLIAIVKKGEQEKWDAAMSAARRIMEDQVKQ